MSTVQPPDLYNQPTPPDYVELASSTVDIVGVDSDLMDYLARLGLLHMGLFRKPLVITSAKDGNHVKGSAHYAGRAVDVRSNDKTDEEQTVFAVMMSYLGPHRGMGVFDERTVITGPHWHIEKQGPGSVGS